MEELLEAIEQFREHNLKMPYAIYVDPITLVNTNFKELELWGIPVKVAYCCPVGDIYLVDKEQADRIETFEKQMEEAWTEK